MKAVRAGWVMAVLLLTTASAQAPEIDSRAAWQVVDLATMRVIESRHPERLTAPAPPGSFMKLPVLVAALASHTIAPTSRVACTGEANVQGHLVRCSHPRVRHALRPDEALALSCNVYFATIGQRLPRARLDGVLTTLGLPPVPRGAPMPLAATGLQATPTPPAALLTALARLVTDPNAVPLDARARKVVLDGLRGSAVYGTSGAFALRGVEAFAKTGTADAPGGGVEGLVVAVWPAVAPTRGIVLVAPGAAGMDAADLAARIAAGAPSASRTVKPGPADVVRTAAPVPDTPSTLRIGTPAAGGGYDVRTMSLEDYVARVLAGEAAPKSPPAALEALAITARTYAVGNRGRHRKDGFDLCTLTHCQVLREPDRADRAAVEATAGQVLMWHGALAQVFYTASCGGVSEVPSAVWPGAADPPYLRVRADKSCRGEPHWESEIPAADLDRVLHAAGFRGGRLRDLRREGRTPSGRVARLRVSGLTPGEIGAQDFRTLVGRTLGWQLVKSTEFTVRRSGSRYHFDGHGFGHGVGLCVLGSVARATRGDKAARILSAYFPGTTMQRLAPEDSGAGDSPATTSAAPSPVSPAAPVAPPLARPASPTPPPAAEFTLDLPHSAERDRATLTALIRTSLSSITRATGQPVPPGIRIVFHPTAASFQRGTGESWWSAARTRGTRIDVLPPDVLQQRGTLEVTLRHELAHLVTAPALEGRDEWVKEGAAMHFAGEPPPQSLLDDAGVPRRVRCPSDLDLRQPASAALARQAYGLAAACFERALAEAAGNWREVR